MIPSIFVTLALLFGQATTNQDPKPDRWRGMVIDVSSPEAAFKLRGSPKYDKIDRLQIFDVDSIVVSEAVREKKYRNLEWKGLDGLKLVTLSFENDKLVRIYLWLDKEKEIPAANLSKTYGLEFSATIDFFTEGMSGPPGRPPLSGGERVNYPTVYALVAESEKTWVTATIGKTGWKPVIDGDTSKSTDAFPGMAVALQLVSRGLEKKAGGDSLK